MPQIIKNQDKYTKYSIFIIVLFSIIVLFLATIYHVSGDGCWHLSAGKFIADNGKIPLNEPLGREEPFWSPPLYHILISIFYLFNDNTNFAIKFISPVFGILSLIFSFLIIKKIYNSRTAFYSIIFLAFVPIFIDYSILSYIESMLVFFVILSVYFILKD
ncbi:MAG: glycosyltransferase family 39 protein, partial [Nanoarchaeota archaeon]